MRWEKASPSWCVMADTVMAGLLGTGMAWGQAQWRQGARWAEAVEAVFPIHAGATLRAGAGRTLIDLHVAKRPWGSHRQPHSKTRTTQPTERDSWSKDILHLLTHQLFCKPEQPPPQPRAAPPQILFIPKLT